MGIAQRPLLAPPAQHHDGFGDSDGIGTVTSSVHKQKQAENESRPRRPSRRENRASRASKKNEQFQLFRPQAAEAASSTLAMLVAAFREREALSSRIQRTLSLLDRHVLGLGRGPAGARPEPAARLDSESFSHCYYPQANLKLKVGCNESQSHGRGDETAGRGLGIRVDGVGSMALEAWAGALRQLQ